MAVAMSVGALSAPQGGIAADGTTEKGDVKAAVVKIAKAAEAGDSEAQYLLGVMQVNGVGAPRNVEKGIEWLRCAAAQDNIEAQFELGQIFQGGRGAPRNSGEMVTWYRRAAELGHVGAQLALGDLYVAGRDVPVDYQQAYMWYKVAAEYWGDLVSGPQSLVAQNLSPEQIRAAEKAAGEILAHIKR